MTADLAAAVPKNLETVQSIQSALSGRIRARQCPDEFHDQGFCADTTPATLRVKPRTVVETKTYQEGFVDHAFDCRGRRALSVAAEGLPPFTERVRQTIA